MSDIGWPYRWAPGGRGVTIGESFKQALLMALLPGDTHGHRGRQTLEVTDVIDVTNKGHQQDTQGGMMMLCLSMSCLSMNQAMIVSSIVLVLVGVLCWLGMSNGQD